MPAKITKAAPAPKYHHGDLRRAIRDAALELIAEEGLPQLSLRGIARKIGVTTAAPYHHFKDRQALLIEIALEGYAALLALLEAAREGAAPGLAEIEAEARAYLRFSREQKPHYAVMFSNDLTNHQSKELKAIADKCFLVLLGSVSPLVGSEGAHAAETALCVWSMLHGLIVLDQSNLLMETIPEQDRIAVKGVLDIVRGARKH